MNMDADILIELISESTSYTEEEKVFLIKNLRNLRTHFMNRFNKDIVITI